MEIRKRKMNQKDIKVEGNGKGNKRKNNGEKNTNQKENQENEGKKNEEREMKRGR